MGIKCVKVLFITKNMSSKTYFHFVLGVKTKYMTLALHKVAFVLCNEEDFWGGVACQHQLQVPVRA